MMAGSSSRHHRVDSARRIPDAVRDAMRHAVRDAIPDARRNDMRDAVRDVIPDARRHCMCDAMRARFARALSPSDARLDLGMVAFLATEGLDSYTRKV